MPPDETTRPPWDLDAHCRGETAVLREVARFVTDCLVHLRAYDFRDEWPYLVQEVLATVSLAARAGRIEQSNALTGYVWKVTRNRQPAETF